MSDINRNDQGTPPRAHRPGPPGPPSGARRPTEPPRSNPGPAGGPARNPGHGQLAGRGGTPTPTLGDAPASGGTGPKRPSGQQPQPGGAPKSAARKAREQGAARAADAVAPGAGTAMQKLSSARERLNQSGSAAGQAAGRALSAVDPTVTSRDRIAQARARGGSGTGTAAIEAASTAAQVFGIPKPVARLALMGIAGAALAGFAILAAIGLGAFVLTNNAATGGIESPEEVSDYLPEELRESFIEAAGDHDLPWTVLAAMNLLATEGGKFSPYPADTVDRDPQRPGLRRPSSPAPDDGAAATTSTTVAPSASTSVFVIGDDACTPGANQDKLRSALAGRWSPTFDCRAGRPISDTGDGDGVAQILTANRGSAPGMIVVAVSSAATTQPADAGAAIDAVMASAGRTPVVWVNVATSTAGAGEVNAALNAAAGRHPYLQVVDLAGSAAGRDNWFAADQTALAPAGVEALGAAVNATLTTASGELVGSAPKPQNPAGLEVSTYPTVNPPIGGQDNEAAGPWLLEPRAVAAAQALNEDFDPQRQDYTGSVPAVTATDLVAAELATIRDSMVKDGWVFDGTPEEIDQAWAEAVRRLPIADPRNASCTVVDPGSSTNPEEAQRIVGTLIAETWRCAISSAGTFYTLSHVPEDGDALLDAVLTTSEAESVVVREALEVSWSFSEWGTTPCRPGDEVAGVFPLTQAVFDAHASAADKGLGRCDRGANIRTAVAAFIARESVPPGETVTADGFTADRSTGPGPHNPLIGGWAAMPWALGNDTTRSTFLQDGRPEVWTPDEQCLAAIEGMLTATAGDDRFASFVDGDDPNPILTLLDVGGQARTTCDAPTDEQWWEAVTSTARGLAIAYQAEAGLSEDTSDNFDGLPVDAGADAGADDPTDTTGGTGDAPQAPTEERELIRHASNLEGIARAAGSTVTTPGPPVGGVDATVARLSATGVEVPGVPPLPPEAVTDDHAKTILDIAALLGGTHEGDDRDPTTNEADGSTGDLAAGAGALAELDEQITGSPTMSAIALRVREALGLVTSPLGGLGTVGDAIPFADLFNQAGAQHGIDARLLAAVAWQESGFSPDVIDCSRRSHAGAMGIMQFMPSTASGFGIDACKPEQAIPAAAQYLMANYSTFGSWELALAAYNAGGGNVKKYGGIPPFEETQKYVPSIMAKWQEYQQLYPAEIPTFGGPVAGGRMEQSASGPVCIVEAAGIQVNCEIANQVASLIEHSRRDGVNLTGSGFRSYQRQIELRSINGCPDTFTASASSCRVPTARPGSSKHEVGLAIDFANCSVRSTACHQWLARNAALYGLKNLPSEAWHWSTTGG